MPSSRGSSQPRNQTQVYCIAGRFFISHKGSPCIGWRTELSKWKSRSQCVTWGQSSLILLLLKTCKHHLPWLSNTFLQFLQPLKLDQLEASSTGQSWENLNINESNNISGLNALNKIRLIIKSDKQKILKQNFTCDFWKTWGTNS